MILRAIAAGLLAITSLIGGPASADDWTPIEPVPSGCPDNGWRLRAVDGDTIRATFPIIADWQLGTLTLDGHTSPFRVVKQVIDETYCQGFKAVVTAPWDGSRWVRYRWTGADGGFLESGTKRVRQ